MAGGWPRACYAQHLITGLIAARMMPSSFQNLAVGIPIERDNGTLKRLAGTPMPPIAYFIGKIVLVLVNTSIQTTLLLGGRFGFLHLRLSLTPAAGSPSAWVGLLGITSCTLAGIASSSVARSVLRPMCPSGGGG